MKKGIIPIVVLFILLIVLIFTNWRIRDRLLELKYDWLNKNEAVYTKNKIDIVLENFEQISYSELGNEYLELTKSDKKRYKNLVSKLTYFKIKRTDLNKKIAGPFRIKEFICKDDYYKACIMNRVEWVICIFNPKIFYKTIELLTELEKLGYDKHGFEIVNGHRHPSYNEKIGGAKLSRHIKGEAVDIIVNDINRDGYVDKRDKDIVLNLLETKIIKNKGGIGLYPGTGNVHYDVRGTKARWNSY